MKYVGIDLHKQTIAVCVVNQERKVLGRKSFLCRDAAGIERWFRELGEFQFVVEATAAYEWLVRLLEPLAARWLLAHPGKMRMIAETARKTDRLDAQVLAEFLALDIIPQSYRPTPRQREHRVLVRYRVKCRQQVTRLKCRMRYLAATYNADRKDLFQEEQLEAFAARAELTAADRFVFGEHRKSYEAALERLKSATRELWRFAKAGPASEQAERAVLRSAPGVGEVISEVVLAELGTVDRFDSIKAATAYAGLAPTQRESAGKSRELAITKKGSRVLRWAMVEGAWQAVQHSARWRSVYEALKKRRGAKKAIVAVARRLLAMLTSMLKSGTPYRASLAELRERAAKEAARKSRRRKASKPATASVAAPT